MAGLEGKSAIVTGGGSGIGLACARAFASDGANVLIMGRNEEKLHAAVDQLRALDGGGRIECRAGDAGSEDAVSQAVARACVEGALDIAVANAGTGALAPIFDTPADDWDRVMQTNLNGAFYLIKHAGNAMAGSGGGAICTISSIAGVRTHRFMGTYCVSKAAIDMLVRNCADELGAAGIRVNSVCPGLVDTELASGLLATEEVYADYLECMPIRRHGETKDIAQAVRFLCGPESSWVTGVVLSVDGGHHLRRGPDVSPFARAMFPDAVGLADPSASATGPEG